jgi:prepilin peptidase CpaA
VSFAIGSDLMLALALVVPTGMAAVVDEQERRIPNRVVLWGAAGALCLRALLPDAAVSAGLWGLLLGFGLMWPLYAFRAMGAGDVKLMAMVGAFVGPAGVVAVTLLSCLAGGVLALGVAARGGHTARLCANVRGMVWGGALNAAVGVREVPAPGQSVGNLPYAVAMALGSAAFFLLRLGGFLT